MRARGLLTHGKDVDAQTLEHVASSAGIVLGLAVRHQNHQLGRLRTETRHGLQVLFQHVGQGQALGAVRRKCWQLQAPSLPTREGSTSRWPPALPTRPVLAPSGCGGPEGSAAPSPSLKGTQRLRGRRPTPCCLLKSSEAPGRETGRGPAVGGGVCQGETP